MTRHHRRPSNTLQFIIRMMYKYVLTLHAFNNNNNENDDNISKKKNRIVK